MNLKQYFDKTGVSQKFFAQKAKISPVTLWKILSGEDLKLSTAIRICEASEWKVTPQDIHKNYESIKNHMKDQSAKNTEENTNT